MILAKSSLIAALSRLSEATSFLMDSYIDGHTFKATGVKLEGWLIQKPTFTHSGEVFMEVHLR